MNKARYNEVLTQKIKTIFGDIVTKAFIVAVNKHEVQHLDRCDSYYTDSEGKEIDTYSLCDLVICFKNGKKVQFNYSEWGTISTAEEFEETESGPTIEQVEENDSTF